MQDPPKQMRNTIAVMNAKGGVGKSTLVLALAETFSAEFGGTVLVIDTDAQASISLMLLSAAGLNRLQLDRVTLVDGLVAAVLNDEDVDWSGYIVAGVSDVEEARSVYLIPSDVQLTLFEREVRTPQLMLRLRASIGALLNYVRATFDVVLIDCAPGLSVVTEAWLREADFQITPTNADFLSSYALEVLGHFKGLNPEMGFAEHLGVLISMRDPHSTDEAGLERRLRETAANRCFAQAMPRTVALQQASRFSPAERSYDTKYPAGSGQAARAVCQDLIDRLLAANGAREDVGRDA